MCSLVSIRQRSYWQGCYTLTWQVNQQCEVVYLLSRGRRLMGDYCPPCACKKASAIHYLVVGTQHQCHLLNDNSVSFYFTYNSCLSTHFTSSLTMATKWGSGTPALSPSVCTIGWICQHTQPTTFWWCYKQMPQIPASLIVRHSKACSNEGTSEKSGNTQQLQSTAMTRKMLIRMHFFLSRCRLWLLKAFHISHHLFKWWAVLEPTPPLCHID